MSEYGSQALTEDESLELTMLADAADAGEDVTLVAFQRLCPTGQEGAFDQNAVFIYQSLADKGYIEGVSEGDEFFFERLTERGIEAAFEPASETPVEQGSVAIPTEEPVADTDDSPANTAHSASKNAITKAFETGELTLPVAAGFIAGLIGGALAAVVIWAII